MTSSGWLAAAWAKGAAEFASDLPLQLDNLPFLLPAFILAWFLQRWLLTCCCNWVPVFGAAWVAFQYGRRKHKFLLEDLNNRSKRHVLYTLPETPLEPCEWLNKLIVNLWPGYMHPKLSNMFSAIMMKRLKEKKPQPFRSIELQEFSLGTVPPSLGLQRTYWSTEGGEQILHMSFEWETSEMNVLLAAKLFKGIARFAVNSLQIKGDLRIVPILDGQALVFSFKSRPDIRVGVAFGGGSQSLPATELPYVASWLEKVFLDTLTRTMVEPRRRCFSLPAVSMKQRATGGVISVTVISAENLGVGCSSRVSSERRSFPTNGSSNGSLRSKQMSSFVEVTLEGLTRSTHVAHHSGAPLWNDSFNMILHESVGSVSFNIYAQGSSNLNYEFLGCCEVRVKYVEDGSTIFWATGPEQCVLADWAESCGKDVFMELPIEGCGDAKLRVKLLLKEWQFTDGSRTMDSSLSGSLSVSSSFLSNYQTHSGRTIKITVEEGKNLAAKDRTGKSDPYVRLRYGKLERKTKTIKQDLNPVWKQGFEFPELGGGEYLQVKCYDADYFSDENLGSARVNLEGLEDGIPKDVWIPLEKIHTGEIRLILEAYNSESEAESSQNGLKDEKFMDKKNGLIEVALLEARDLTAADIRGTSDPFVTVQCGSEKRTTKVIHKTLQPQWNQSFELNDCGKPLLLYVKDHNAFLPAVNIGHCKVEYERLPMDQPVKKWIPLQGVRKGEIHVKVTRRPPPTSCRPPTTHNSPPVTHAKLLKRSDKVRALLQQVRGMTITGDADAICKKVEELELAEDEKSVCISRLIQEKHLLIEKVKELEKAMQGLQDTL